MRRPGEWRQDAPPFHGIRSALGRARNRKLEVTLTEEEWATTLTFFEDSCAYCRKVVWCLIDHVTSVDRGGGITWANCLPACGSCNRYKGQRTLEELILRISHRDRRGGQQARLYAAVSANNLTRALAFLREHGRPLMETITTPLRCSHDLVCSLGHLHQCRLTFGHDGEHNANGLLVDSPRREP